MELENPLSVELKNMFNARIGSIVARLFEPAADAEKTQLAFSDLQECSFPGYSPVVLSPFEVTTEDSTEIGEILSETIRFEQTVDSAPQVAGIFCVMIEETGQPKRFLHAEVFTRPVTFQFAGDNQEFIVRIESRPDEN